MWTTWIIIGVGVADLAIRDSKFKRFPKFFRVVCRQQSNSLDKAFVFYPHGFNLITVFPQKVSKLLHVNLRHPACNYQFGSKLIDPLFDKFDCIKDDARLFVVTLNCECLSTSCLAMTYYRCLFSISNCVFNNIFCFHPYNFLVGLFRKSLVKGINLVFFISLDWLSLF
jgi:hypothetical protein